MRYHRLLALSVALLLALWAIPCLASPVTSDQPKHPFLSRMFIWLVRSNYKPKQVTAAQSDAQARLESNNYYVFARDRAKEIGLQPVLGEIKEVRVPDWHKSKFLFFVIPISLEYLPTSFLLQPVVNTDNDKHGLIIAVAQNQQVSTAAYVDANGFGDASKINTDVPKLTLVHYMREDILKRCGSPCLNKMAGCANRLAIAPVNIHAAVSAYLLCVLGNKECGGCLLDGLAQSILDYATQVKDVPAEKVLEVPSTEGQ